MSILKRTPLFGAHQKLGARLVEFGGWEMPVQYTGIVQEHLAVRQAAGIFDISHMGEVRVRGAAAGEFLNHVLTNNVQKLEPGQGQYTLMCREDGGTVDDLYVFCLAPADYFLVINASRIEADVAWLTKQWSGAYPDKPVVLENVSEAYGAVAIQGPRVIEFIDAVCEGNAGGGAGVVRPQDMQKNQIAQFRIGGAQAWISRTGYTGEDGFEVYVPADQVAMVWDRIMDAGGRCGLVPAGLGARDTLRTEVCYPLYGHELDEQTTPIEAGLGYFVDFTKPEFVGRAVLANQKKSQPPKKLVAFKMICKSAPPRPGYLIWRADDALDAIGVVSSGTSSPSMGYGVGMGYVPPQIATPGTRIAIEIRNQRYPAEIVTKPFYKKQKSN